MLLRLLHRRLYWGLHRRLHRRLHWRLDRRLHGRLHRRLLRLLHKRLYWRLNGRLSRRLHWRLDRRFHGRLHRRLLRLLRRRLRGLLRWRLVIRLYNGLLTRLITSNEVVSSHHTCFDSCSLCNCLVWVENLIQGLAKELFQHLLHLGDARRSSYHKDLVNVLFVKVCLT